MKFQEYRLEIETKIAAAYENMPTLGDAESLALYFLQARLIVGTELRRVSLDARMRKTGVKAVKAAVLIDAATAGDKKPADSILAALVDSNEKVQAEQFAFDTAEVDANDLQNLLEVTKEAHIFMRGLAKGRMD